MLTKKEIKEEMPNKKRLFLILLALTAAIFVLAACAPQEPAEEPAAEEPAAEELAAEEPAAAGPDRRVGAEFAGG